MGYKEGHVSGDSTSGLTVRVQFNGATFLKFISNINTIPDHTQQPLSHRGFVQRG